MSVWGVHDLCQAARSVTSIRPQAGERKAHVQRLHTRAERVGHQLTRDGRPPHPSPSVITADRETALQVVHPPPIVSPPTTRHPLLPLAFPCHLPTHPQPPAPLQRARLCVALPAPHPSVEGERACAACPARTLAFVSYIMDSRKCNDSSVVHPEPHMHVCMCRSWGRGGGNVSCGPFA